MSELRRRWKQSATAAGCALKRRERRAPTATLSIGRPCSARETLNLSEAGSFGLIAHPSGRDGAGRLPKWPTGADCKSAGLCLRWFESITYHHLLNIGRFSLIPNKIRAFLVVSGFHILPFGAFSVSCLLLQMYA